MQNQEQMSVVTAAFERWRNHRNGRQAPTPPMLRKQAVSLLNTYSCTQITSALKIGASQLKQWRNTIEIPEKTSHFVELPVSPALTHNPFNVELCFVSGDQLRLCGVVDRDVIKTLIDAMRT